MVRWRLLLEEVEPTVKKITVKKNDSANSLSQLDIQEILVIIDW